MAKAVWTGSLAFGLVSILVRLYPATERKVVRFHLVDAGGRRVRYRRFVPAEEPEKHGLEAAEVEEAHVAPVGGGREPEQMPSAALGGEAGLPGAEGSVGGPCGHPV